MTTRLLGESEFIREMRRMVRILADSPMPIYIDGESGTGKSFLAQLLHFESTRKGEFLCFDSESLSLTDVSAIIEKISAKKDIAEGSIFFDNYDLLPDDAQDYIANIMESSIDLPMRFIFAANEFLQKNLSKKTSAVHFHTLSLRERREDIVPLATYFLQNLSEQRFFLTEEAKQALYDYSWPGNIVELKDLLGLVMKEKKLGEMNIEAKDFGFTKKQEQHLARIQIDLPFGTSMSEIELEIIKKTLDACGGNKAEAARALGINVRTIYRRVFPSQNSEQ